LQSRCSELIHVLDASPGASAPFGNAFYYTDNSTRVLTVNADEVILLELPSNDISIHPLSTCTSPF